MTVLLTQIKCQWVLVALGVNTRPIRLWPLLKLISYQSLPSLYASHACLPLHSPMPISHTKPSPYLCPVHFYSLPTGSLFWSPKLKSVSITRSKYPSIFSLQSFQSMYMQCYLYDCTIKASSVLLTTAYCTHKCA